MHHLRLVLTEPETGRLAAALAALLPDHACMDSHAWGASVVHSLRVLVGAPKAVFVIETAGATRAHGDLVDLPVVDAYARRYAALDLGLQRQRTLGIEVWRQSVLWHRSLLVRSEYYSGFAQPHRMHDPFGLAVTLGLPTARARIAFFHEEPGAEPSVVARQLALLSLVLPAFKAAMRTHARSEREDSVAAPRAEFGPLLDAAEEAFALCDATGRVLYANGAMALALEASGAADLLRHTLSDVARATITAAAPARSTLERAAAAREFTTLEVRTPRADFRVRGSVVESGDADAGAPGVVLVSLRRSAPARVDELRARFGLTAREAEIADRLLLRASNAEIAQALALSPHTARHHTERILRKLGVHSRTALGDVIGPSPTRGD